ncbi:sigma-70 family RNA polymerase sigma factor [Amycolatopsis sp. K13G38]|uniref:Sigma-70 family RNA polymerase sigma factor n=1 Tax=Amycolatopsis acididurans TaxID=2724524 RepID=A0ABX1J1P3_9PSEU|nr:sigma-70 family RNA polymerase sigma factor [Amycolatopsis acididurans]NKQ53569.1 sigma-70 family RNA polymerase sigma factor [Amycolatopsis acididurans]
MVSPVERELVVAAMEGDSVATTELVRRLQPLVRRYCHRRISARERWRIDVDDVVQEVSIAVVHALPRYRYQIQAFVPYTYGIASKKIAEHRRAMARETVLPAGDLTEEKWALPDRSADPERRSEQSATRHELVTLLNTLAPPSRAVVLLRVVEGLSARETADRLGMPSCGAVRVAQHRALSQLRTRLVEQTGEIAVTGSLTARAG